MRALNITSGSGTNRVPNVWQGAIQPIDQNRGTVSFHWDAAPYGADRYIVTLSKEEDNLLCDTCITTSAYTELIYPRPGGRFILKIESLKDGMSASFIIVEEIIK